MLLLQTTTPPTVTWHPEKRYNLVLIEVNFVLMGLLRICLFFWFCKTHTAFAVATSKLVLVTGGARGIGKATCLHLAERGYNVAINYHQNTELANQLVQEILQKGGHAAAFQADVSQEDQVQSLFDDVYDYFQMNPVGLVNNAGVMEAMEKDILKVSAQILERDFRVNTLGPFLCSKEFVRRCSTKNGENGGSIVCVSSVSSESAQILAYGMSKAALEVMVTGLSKTLPLEGIRINTVVPGLIDTGLASPAIMETMKGFIPLRRAGEPSEVARAIEFLLSEESSYCCGAKLRVAGGL
jgi:NAD(P)-dependent dehydrogenase (short-subunit alcohol dehydrogenase family)